MKITKYSKSGSSNPALSSGSGGGSSSSTEYVGASLNRTIWGQSDTSDDVDGSMTVHGNINIKVIEDLPDIGDDEDDEDGEVEDYETGGGSLFVDLTVRAKDIEAVEDLSVGRHLYINYPSHPQHSDENKKCIGEILYNVESDISTNKSEISTLKNRVSSAESDISTNKSNIAVNADEIDKLKKRATATETKIENYMPIGSIIMYNGLASEIPENWAICDGTNGTPDLTDKFIKAGTTTGQTGGSNSIKLNPSDIPEVTLNVDNDLVTTFTGTAQYERLAKEIHTSDWVDSRVIDTGGSTNYCISDGKNKGDSGLLGVPYTQVFKDIKQFMYGGNRGETQTAIDVQPEYYSLIFLMKIA